MEVEYIKLKNHNDEEKSRYFEESVIQLIRYKDKNGIEKVPLNFKVDTKEKKTELDREKWNYFMQVVFGEKNYLLNFCSPSFVKLVESFKQCSENAGIFEANSKEELMERFSWVDEMVKYFNLSGERNVEKKNDRGKCAYFDYFVEKCSIGMIFHEGSVNIEEDKTISYCISNARGYYNFSASMIIDSEFVYWTCASWNSIHQCYKINHSTIEGQCELFVALLNNIGINLFEHMHKYPLELLQECMASFHLPLHAPIRDEIIEMSKRDMVDKDLWLGLPFRLTKSKFYHILKVEAWKYYKADISHLKFKLNCSNRFKISKQRKSKYHEKVKSINLKDLRIY